MSKQADQRPEIDSINVQGRLTRAEAAELDFAAQSQPVPVARGALVAHILREWLKSRRDAKGKGGRTK